MENATSDFQRDITSGLLVKDIWKLERDRHYAKYRCSSYHFSQLPPGPMPEESLKKIYRQGMIDIGKAGNITKLVLNQYRSPRHYRNNNLSKRVKEFRKVGTKYPFYKYEDIPLEKSLILDPFPTLLNPPFEPRKKKIPSKYPRVYFFEGDIVNQYPRRKPEYVSHVEPQCEYQMLPATKTVTLKEGRKRKELASEVCGDSKEPMKNNYYFEDNRG